MGGFLRETKKELQDSGLFWISIIIHEAKAFPSKNRWDSWINYVRFWNLTDIHRNFPFFFLDFYSVGKDSFRISNGKNQEIGNNGSKVNSKEEYYIQ